MKLPFNPLLDFSGLPRFNEIKPEHVAPALDELLAAARSAVASSVAAPATWDAFVAPLDLAVVTRHRVVRQHEIVVRGFADREPPADDLREAFVVAAQDERLNACRRAEHRDPRGARRDLGAPLFFVFRVAHLLRQLTADSRRKGRPTWSRPLAA